MTTAERLTVGQGRTLPSVTPDEARLALVLADRDTKLAAWERLYDTLYPRPAGAGIQTPAPGRACPGAGSTSRSAA